MAPPVPSRSTHHRGSRARPTAPRLGLRSGLGLGLVAAASLGCAPPAAAPADLGAANPATAPAGAPGPGAVAPNATVTRVTDGDTIHVERSGRDETVRLIGIDTPETKKPNTPVECFGPEAAAHLQELLPPGTPVRLERDVEARDTYNRTLAYVYLPDGSFVNLLMVANGFAGPLTIAPNVAHAAELTDATRAARQRDAGLWAACGGNHVAARS